MNISYRSATLAAAIAATLAASGIAQGATEKKPARPAGTVQAAPAPAKPSLSGMDKSFVTKATQAGLAEVEIGKLAAANAANADLKKFGERMTQDHAKAGDELKQIATSKGLAPPAETDRTHKRLAKQLASLNGEKFDRVYVRETGVKDHKAAVALFTNEANKGKDPELRAFAEKTLPTIKEHLKMAEDLDHAVYVKK